MNIVLKRLFVFLFIILITSSCGDYCNDYLKHQEISGQITKKYRDNNDHYLKKLEVSNENGRHIMVIDDKDNKFWNFIAEGYYLSKKKGSTEIVIRKNKTEYTFDICNN